MASIVLCVTGSIAAYKAAEVASRLVSAGHEVTAVMSRAAQELVGPATFRNLTGRHVYTDLWAPVGQTEHIALTDRADLVVVAPATANCLAKLAHGLADDMVSTTMLAVRSPVLVCPAMNTRMWRHPAVQRNLEAVRAFGHHVLEPGAGRLACGHVGPGRLAEPEEIVAACARLLAGAAAGAPAASPPAGARAEGQDTFLELVTHDAPPPADALALERAYRDGLRAEGALLASGPLGTLRRAHVLRAGSLDAALALARGAPLASHGGRIEVFPWRLEGGLGT